MRGCPGREAGHDDSGASMMRRPRTHTLISLGDHSFPPMSSVTSPVETGSAAGSVLTPSTAMIWTLGADTLN
jgi:hypothetical protein